MYIKFILICGDSMKNHEMKGVIKLSTTPKVRKKINLIKKKMGFQSEPLFLRYCLMKAFRPYATENQKQQISKELKIINKRKREMVKKK